MNTIRIESASVEALSVDLESDSDPTGGDVEFQVTATTVTSPDSGSWTAGSWGSYANGRVTATTPTLGGSGALISLTESTPVTLWIRVGSATILKVATVVVG